MCVPLLQLAVPRSTTPLLSLRGFSTSHIIQAKLTSAARNSKKRTKKSIYDAEKMTLADAIHVLRVRS
jgi:hypothetical protein